MNSSYNKHSPVTSIDRGGFVSATWGIGSRDEDYFTVTVTLSAQMVLLPETMAHSAL